MLPESSRPTGLRWPQCGTPDSPSPVKLERDDLVGDAALIDLGLESPGNAVLCGLLLKTQIRTYKRTGHIISFADEFVMRKIRNHARLGTVPRIYCRCMRCGCLALLFDWLVAGDLADDPLMADRRFAGRVGKAADTSFFAQCAGNEKARDGLLLMD